MDDYVSKPVDPKEFDAALRRVAGNVSTPIGPPAFDHAFALTMVGDDDGVLRTLAEMFVAQSPKRVDAILGAVAMADSDAMKRAAHSLRGTASTLGMRQLADVALTLEERGDAGRAAESGEVAADFERAMAAAVEALRSTVLSD